MVLACFLSVEKTKNFNQSASRHLPPPAQAISYRHRLLLAPASRPPAAVPSGAPAALNRLRRSPPPGRRLTGSHPIAARGRRRPCRPALAAGQPPSFLLLRAGARRAASTAVQHAVAVAPQKSVETQPLVTKQICLFMRN